MNSIAALIIGTALVLSPAGRQPDPPTQVMLKVAVVVSVHDGDTFNVDLEDCAIPVLCRNIPVRIRGVDAPELNGHCVTEVEKAEAARTELDRLVRGVKRIILLNPSRDKYFRLDADVQGDGHDVADALRRTGLYRDYAGGKRNPWCIPLSVYVLQKAGLHP